MGFVEKVSIPAIPCQIRSYVLQVIVPHVLDAEDVDVGELWNAFLDVGVEAQGQFLALFLRLCEVHYFCAL